MEQPHQQFETTAIEINSSRLLPFPRELVFQAFSNPSHLSQWWGPNGFTNTIHEFDLRPGGAFRLTMHGPNGANYENVKEFIEVAAPEKIVFRHIQPIHNFLMSMTFDDVSGQTQLHWRMEFFDREENEKFRDFILEANEQNFDRLEEHLKRMRDS